MEPSTAQYVGGVERDRSLRNVEDRIRERQPVEEIADLGGKANSLAYEEFEFKKNDVVYMRVASGDGYGDPLERDPQSVLADVIDDIVSEKTAREVYGVALDEKKEAVDITATRNSRSSLLKERVKTTK